MHLSTLEWRGEEGKGETGEEDKRGRGKEGERREMKVNCF